MIELRPEQADLVHRVRAEYARGSRSVLMQLPTGGGKTATASEIIRMAIARGRSVIFLAHLDALIEDTAERVTAAGLRCGYVQADRPTDPAARVQVCSIATLHRRGFRPAADLVIVDECHRALAPTVRDILDAYPKARLLGLTATPQRGDGQPMGDVFDTMVCGPSVSDLMTMGRLVDCEVIAPTTLRETALACDPIDAWEKWTPGARAIVFAANVEHATQLVERWRARGVEAELLIGDTPREERRALRDRMTTGSLQVIVNVAVAVEGFDLPAIETVILARSFSVCGSYLQAIGRGLRPSPATRKTKCTVLDLRGAALLHGLPDDERQWSLSGEAVIRMGESLIALRRCEECFAIFRPAASCPRCGARPERMAKVPRVLSKAEKLHRLSGITPEQRDEKYLTVLRSIARVHLRLPSFRVEEWARKQFRKRFGREPNARAA